MLKNDTIRLFWWNEIKLMHKSKENYGDMLGKYLVEKISSKKVSWVAPKKFSLYNFYKPIYVTIGSILAHVNENCIVWGSGIISKSIPVKKAKFLAVRGPQTRKYLLSLGYDVPEVYGDPALLLPDYYNPKVEKKYKFGVVPHYHDYPTMSKLYQNHDDLLVIDLMTNDIEEVTRKFLQCERVVSTSLHGVIVSHTYQIPAVWVQFSNNLFGDGVKFQDYFESVDIPTYIPVTSSGKLSLEDMDDLFLKYPSLPKEEKITELKKGLMANCPFTETK